MILTLWNNWVHNNVVEIPGYSFFFFFIFYPTHVHKSKYVSLQTELVILGLVKVQVIRWRLNIKHHSQAVLYYAWSDRLVPFPKCMFSIFIAFLNELHSDGQLFDRLIFALLIAWYLNFYRPFAWSIDLCRLSNTLSPWLTLLMRFFPGFLRLVWWTHLTLV